MKKIIGLSFFLFFSLLSCDAQEKFKKDADKTDTIKPKTSYKVHKEYDENGNLISVDSTYTYFYSNIKNDSILEKQFFDRFKGNFYDEFHLSDSLVMKGFMGDDILDFNDFYTDEFFQNNFKRHRLRMEEIFKRMDSLKNNFYHNKIEKIEKNKI